MFPRYLAGGREFTTLQQAAKAMGAVSLNDDYDPPPRPGRTVMPIYEQHANALLSKRYTRATLFREILSRPAYDVPEDIGEIYAKPPGRRMLPLDELAPLGVDALRRAIAREWKSDKHWLMPHSSGYDSRLVSALLREHKTGNVRFLCWQPEVVSARRVIESIGWAPEHIYEIGEGDWDYQAPALDFIALGAYQTEAERFIPGPSLVEQHLAASRHDWLTITAAFADETLAFARAGWPSIAYFHAGLLLDSPEP
jgi:hypothetical protein